MSFPAMIERENIHYLISNKSFHAYLELEEYFGGGGKKPSAPHVCGTGFGRRATREYRDVIQDVGDDALRPNSRRVLGNV